MDDKLQKAINLSRKTGDRLIIFDYARSNDPFVIMSMDEYERIALGNTDVRGLTEDELLDKINRDIAVWKTDQEKEELDLPSRFDKAPEEGNFEEEDTDFEPNMKDFNISQYSEDKPTSKKKWSIPDDRKKGAEEIIEEDRQYLEEIPY